MKKLARLACHNMEKTMLAALAVTGVEMTDLVEYLKSL
jgi:hypothetical protein